MNMKLFGCDITFSSMFAQAVDWACVTHQSFIPLNFCHDTNRNLQSTRHPGLAIKVSTKKKKHALCKISCLNQLGDLKVNLDGPLGDPRPLPLNTSIDWTTQPSSIDGLLGDQTFSVISHTEHSIPSSDEEDISLLILKEMQLHLRYHMVRENSNSQIPKVWMHVCISYQWCVLY